MAKPDHSQPAGFRARLDQTQISENNKLLANISQVLSSVLFFRFVFSLILKF